MMRLKKPPILLVGSHTPTDKGHVVFSGQNLRKLNQHLEDLDAQGLAIVAWSFATIGRKAGVGKSLLGP